MVKHYLSLQIFFHHYLVFKLMWALTRMSSRASEECLQRENKLPIDGAFARVFGHSHVKAVRFIYHS